MVDRQGVVAGGFLLVLLFAGPSMASDQLPPTPPGDHPPKLISGSCTPPDYPKDAMGAKQEGTVVVDAYVNEAGSVTMVGVTSSSGSDSLDKAAQRFFATCRFEPAIRSGVRVPGKTAVQYNWKIRP